MSDMYTLFKLLLNKEFYDSHIHKIPVKAFDELGQKLLKSLPVAHSSLGRDLSVTDLVVVHQSMHPTMTTAEETAIVAYLDAVQSADIMQPDAGKIAFETMWRKEVGRKISEYGINLIDGDRKDITALSDMLARVGGDFIPKDFNEAVDTNPVTLFERLNQRGRWTLNIPYLDERIPHVSPGQFIIILARPESGKTATIVNLIAGKRGFAAQGANVHLLANEEGADVTAGRAICCFAEKPYEEVRANPSIAMTPEWADVSRRMFFVHQPEISLTQLDFYCKKNRPDVLIIDQLDHVAPSGDYNSSAEKLGAIYRKAREIASKYDCVVVAVSQASAEAEGKSVVTYSHAENSKTAKAAAADLIVGIGKVEDLAGEESNEVTRYFTVSKNKISGWKGTKVCKLVQNESRLTR